MTSHGRGGAGNISSTPSATNPDDLITPTIKGDTYSTGRGGSGNMVKNDPTNPAKAREAQDVAAPMRQSSHERSHIGRGGVANTTDQPDDPALIHTRRPSAHHASKLSQSNVNNSDQTRAGTTPEPAAGAVGGARERSGSQSGPAAAVKQIAEKGKEILKGHGHTASHS